MSFKTAAAAIICGAVMLTTVSPAQAADTEIVDVSGTGAQASFVFETEIKGVRTLEGGATEECEELIGTELDVQVTTGSEHFRPGGPSSTSVLGVEIEQTVVPGDECDTGYEPVSGQDVVTDFDFTTDPNLGGGQLTAAVLALTDDDREVVFDLSVTWEGADTETVQQNTHTNDENGHRVVNEKHSGAVARISATAEIDLSGESFDSLLTSGASLWDTASRRITVTDAGPSAAAQSTSLSSTQSSSLSSSTVASTTCTGSGYWGGYWTWTGSAWVWTWVWYQCGTWVSRPS